MDPVRSSKLWKQLSPERRLEAARAFWENEEDADQTEAVVAIAQQLRFRPKSAAALPAEKLAKYLAGLPTISDVLASRLLISYHLSQQRPMMSRFLDELGIAHDNGLITEERIAPPEAARLAVAAEALRRDYPHADVDLYFATLVSQDPETWEGLVGVRSGIRQLTDTRDTVARSES